MIDLAKAALLRACELLEAAEDFNANDCHECEGEGVPEACPVCFPLFDDARVARRNAIAMCAATASPHPAPTQTLDDQIPSSSPVLGVGREEIAEAQALIEAAKTTLGPFAVRSAKKPTHGHAVNAIWQLSHAIEVLTKADAILSLLVGGRGDSSGPSKNP